MFKQVTSDIQGRVANDICASSKRHVVYVAFDGTVYEVSLDTKISKLIYTFPYRTDCALACDDNDNLLIRSYDVLALWVQLTPSGESWLITNHTNRHSLSIPAKIRHSHYPFSDLHKSLYEEESYSYVKGNIFNYYNGKDWKTYTLQGSISFNTQAYVWWVVADGDDVLFSLINTPYPSQVWRARGDQAVLLWYGGYREPQYITYSPFSRELYGLSSTEIFSLESSSPWETSFHVSVYQIDIPSLFNLCASIINREKMINCVPPCLQEQVANPETERYIRHKDKVFSNRYCDVLTDSQLRELYNNLPM